MEDDDNEATTKTKTNITIKQCTREIEGGEDDGGGKGRRMTDHGNNDDDAW